MASVRVCLVGCGRIAKLHLNALQRLKDVKVVGMVDPVEESGLSLKQQLSPDNGDCRIFNSVESANESLAYDVAVIMVPHNLHVDLARKCILAGKHVLLEKPVASTLSGCKELIELAKSTDRVFMIAENARFWPEVVEAKKLIDEGVIGEVYFGQANYWETLCGENFHGDEGQPDWADDPAQVGGGLLMAGTVHWIRGLRILLGEIEEVQGFLAYPRKQTTGESLTHSLLRHSNGIPGVLHTHVMDIPMAEIPFFQIFGTKGEICIHGDFEGGLTVHTKADYANNNTKQLLGGYRGAFPLQMEEFISRVKDGRPLERANGGSVWEGTRDVMVTMAIYRSAESKKWETVNVEL